MKTLYVTDLDGTLLNRHDRVSPFSVRVINDLVDRGLQDKGLLSRIKGK